MSQFSKKLYLSKRPDDSFSNSKGFLKKKGYVPQITSQPKLNLTSK